MRKLAESTILLPSSVNCKINEDLQIVPVDSKKPYIGRIVGTRKEKYSSPVIIVENGDGFYNDQVYSPAKYVIYENEDNVLDGYKTLSDARKVFFAMSRNVNVSGVKALKLFQVVISTSVQENTAFYELLAFEASIG